MEITKIMVNFHCAVQFLLLLLFSTAVAAQQTGTVHLQFRHQIDVPGDESISIKRWDYLVSNVGFRYVDSEENWVDSENWFGYVSAIDNDGSAFQLTGVPLGKIDAIRFTIGLDRETNERDPNSWPPGHALNPQVNGLQWEWQGGYIFMALEGIFGQKSEGFSYHLARDRNSIEVELPVQLDLKRGATIAVLAEVQKILGEGGILPGRENTSTHSREGDPIVELLKTAILSAFSVKSVTTDLFQVTVTGGDDVSRQLSDSGLAPVSSRFPRVSFPEDNPLTEAGIALGRQLFHDPVLSLGEVQSCATCHEKSRAFTDGKRFSEGADGTVGKRNSMALFNLAWHDSFFWDGRVKTLREQVLHPIQDPAEMGETLPSVVAKLETYAEEFRAAFGDPEITPDRIARSLEQFLLTLVSQDSKFDRAARGEVDLTDQERRGLQLFVTEHDPENGQFGADCFHCHGGNLFVSKSFANNGLDVDFIRDEGKGGGLFKVPSLRNIEVTGPYMHDGRFETLEEVVEHYNSGVKRSETLDPNLAKHPEGGLNLSTEDKAALIAFLKTLTDSSFLESETAVISDQQRCNAFAPEAQEVRR